MSRHESIHTENRTATINPAPKSSFRRFPYVNWAGNSGWYLMQTIESFNGQVVQISSQGNFIKWFSSNAFGGTNYSNTPVGAVSNVEEPGPPSTSYGAIYFGLWASGKNSGICAWNARNTPYFQAVGDPFVTR
jgi:hypothetical protein